ncbi:MAG: ComF family protein [Chloroflexi bacterium]|nr:ComF family protein [Chloroflexota bacterium]
MTIVARVGEAIGGVASRALDLALPPRCAGCRREGSPLCRECRSWLMVRVRMPPGAPIGLPAEIPEPLLQLEWCAPFTGTVRRAIHELKYGGERRLARPLGEAVAERWRHAAAGGDVLVPVPASPDRIRDRGYDHAAMLAGVAARRLRLPVVQVLERTHDTTAQHALGRSGRSENVGRAFRSVGPAAEARVAGRWVVLVDDVVTTGATLGACARALMDAGASAVSAVTVARER